MLNFKFMKKVVDTVNETIKIESLIEFWKDRFKNLLVNYIKELFDLCPNYEVMDRICSHTRYEYSADRDQKLVNLLEINESLLIRYASLYYRDKKRIDQDKFDSYLYYSGYDDNPHNNIYTRSDSLDSLLKKDFDFWKQFVIINDYEIRLRYDNIKSPKQILSNLRHTLKVVQSKLNKKDSQIRKFIKEIRQYEKLLKLAQKFKAYTKNIKVA